MAKYHEKLLQTFSVPYSALTGEGTFGNVLGKKSEKEDAAQKVLKDAAELKAAQGQAAAQESSMQEQSMKKGGVVRSSASSRADGIATKGKTKGTMIMCGGGMARGK
jgi:hypothetical protein